MATSLSVECPVSLGVPTVWESLEKIALDPRTLKRTAGTPIKHPKVIALETTRLEVPPLEVQTILGQFV